MVSLICYSKRMKNSLQVNDCVKVKIDAVAFGGEGVGRVKNVVVFVAFSAPGDELEIKIVQVKKRFARGKILKIIRHSPWRTSPLCKYYERCGGCCYQHIDYEYQLQIKKNKFRIFFVKSAKSIIHLFSTQWLHPKNIIIGEKHSSILRFLPTVSKWVFGYIRQ